MGLFLESMRKARALTQKGQLLDATREIQRGLGSMQSHTAPLPAPVTGSCEPDYLGPQTSNEPDVHPDTAPSRSSLEADIEDVEFREVLTTPSPPAPTEESDFPSHPTPSSFSREIFTFGSKSYAYRLFIPSNPGTACLPLVVMLHGCKQDSQDFAIGTTMNTLAERDKFMVLYPEQNRKFNRMGCWKWFEPAHQQRGQGEPAMIAALSAHVIASHAGDASRTYVAGLSAGAAMAALAGKLYPETFAAVGVHSGLAPGAACDVASAFSAMSRGSGQGAMIGAIGVPTIVFQGTGDATVAPGNADAIVKSELAFWSAKGVKLSKRITEENFAGAARPVTRSVWRDEAGQSLVELWSVNAGPHAWSGGDAAGSFTDPKGPSASEAMFEFFKLHANAAD